MSVYCQAPKQHRNTGWYVEQYMHHRSAFQGGRVTPSPRSLVRCALCGALWRTSAQYTHTLPRTAPVSVSPDSGGPPVTVVDTTVVRGSAGE